MNANRLIFVVALFFVFSAIALAQKTLELQYPSYTVTVFSQPRSEDETKGGAFLIARQRTSQGKALGQFGIFLRDAGGSPGSQTMLEIIDAAKNLTIKKVSLDEYFGKKTTGWQSIDADSKTSPDKLISAYRIRTGPYDIRLTREIAITADRNLPMGKKISVTVSMESNTPLKIRTKFIGTATGSWKSTGTSFVIADNDTLSPLHPALVFHPLPGSSIEAGRPAKKNGPVRFTLTTKDVLVSRVGQTTVFALETAGTTVSFREHVERQAKNLQSYFDTHIGRPEVIAVSVANKMSSRPGDTLMFSLYSHNIGTAAATENALNNMIPAGTLYLEGSAEGNGSVITYTRRTLVLPQAGPVTNLTWKFQEPLYPGEERTASFKVTIQ